MVNIFRICISREYTDISCKRNFAQRSVRAQRALELEGNAIYALRWNYRPLQSSTSILRDRPNVRETFGFGPRTNFSKLSEPYCHHRFFHERCFRKLNFLTTSHPFLPPSLPPSSLPSFAACIKLIGTAA